jgi:kinesin family protein 5
MSLPAVTVSCRVRPRNPKADLAGGFDCLYHDDRSVRPADRHQTFTFDSVFGGEAGQATIFDQTARPLVESWLGGINCTIMTYGQTGSGKTFTMMGSREEPGVTPRVVDAIFRSIEEAPDTMEFTIRVSYLEIYMERVRDLLNADSTNLTIRQDAVRGIFVEGASRPTLSHLGGAAAVLRGHGRSRGARYMVCCLR